MINITKSPLIYISIISILARFSYHFLFNHFDTPNLSAYWALSTSLLHSESFLLPITEYEPIYPYFLYVLRLIGNDNILFVISTQIICATLTGYYLYRITHLLTSKKIIGYIAFLTFAIHPYLIMQSTSILDMTIFIMFLVIAVYYFYMDVFPRSYILAGLFFGLSVSTRASGLPIVLLTIIILLYRKQIKETLFFSIMFLLIFIPNYLNNYKIDGSFFPPTRSGWDLVKGNNEIYDQILPKYSVDLLNTYIANKYFEANKHKINSSIRNDILTKNAMGFIHKNPIQTIKNNLKKFFYFYYPRIIPYYPMSLDTKLVIDKSKQINIINSIKRPVYKELIYTIFSSFLLILFLIGIYLRRYNVRTDIILYVVLFMITAIHIVYWPSTRLKMPSEFVLIFFSSYSLNYLLRKKFTYKVVG